MKKERNHYWAPIYRLDNRIFRLNTVPKCYLFIFLLKSRTSFVSLRISHPKREELNGLDVVATCLAAFWLSNYSGMTIPDAQGKIGARNNVRKGRTTWLDLKSMTRDFFCLFRWGLKNTCKMMISNSLRNYSTERITGLSFWNSNILFMKFDFNL